MKIFDTQEIKVWLLNHRFYFIVAGVLLVIFLAVFYYRYVQFSARRLRFETVYAEQYVSWEEMEVDAVDVKGEFKGLLVPEPFYVFSLRSQLPLAVHEGEPVTEFASQIPTITLVSPPDYKGPGN